MLPFSVLFTVDSLKLGWLWHCPQILGPDWKRFPSSLLGLVDSDEGKKFNKIDTRRRKVPRMKQISEILRIPAPTPETVDLETGNGDG
jgi:hypothetical protein